jgi:hypothetical protein
LMMKSIGSDKPMFRRLMLPSDWLVNVSSTGPTSWLSAREMF